MSHAIARKGAVAAVENMSVDHRSPTLVEGLLVCEAWIVRHEGRKIDVAATIVNGRTNAAVAEGRGSFLEADLDKLLDASGPMGP